MRNFELSRGICMFSRNFVEFGTGWWYGGQRRHILVEFRWPNCMYTWFCHEIYHCHSGCNGRNIENIELSLSEILTVYLVDRMYLSVAVTGDKCCRVQFSYYMWKFAVEFGKLARGILKNLPRKTVFPTYEQFWIYRVLRECCMPYVKHMVVAVVMSVNQWSVQCNLVGCNYCFWQLLWIKTVVEQNVILGLALQCPIGDAELASSVESHRYIFYCYATSA